MEIFQLKKVYNTTMLPVSAIVPAVQDKQYLITRNLTTFFFSFSEFTGVSPILLITIWTKNGETVILSICRIFNKI